MQKRPRLRFLDWMRGVAAVIILQGHTFHSFTRDDLRGEAPFVLSQFIGGMASAIFLFLTGVTFAFILERRQLPDGRSRWVAALKRSRYLLALAILFRLQLWTFGLPHSHWTDLFKVDVLNCMALTMLVLSPLAWLSLTERVRWSAVAGLVIAVAAPMVSTTDLHWMPAGVRSWIVPDYNAFAFFPWAAFIAFGVTAGSILRSITAEQLNRTMQWSALMGFGLLVGCQYFSNLPYSLYTKSEFWLDSPMLTGMKLGILLIFAAGAYLWVEHITRDRWSWIMQLGTTSLLVYWVHIELVYGRWFAGFKNRLDAGQVVIYSICLIGAMLAMSILRTKWRDLPIREWLRPSATLEPDRVPGD